MTNIGHNNPPREGYILIFRKLLNHPVVGMMKPVKPHKENKPSASRLEAWLDLLMMATHDSKTVTVNGHKFELERGDQACAMSYLSKRWNWSPKTTRGFIERLMGHEMVERKGQTKDKRPTHISICNYSDYQDGAQYGAEKKGNRKGNRKGNKEGQDENELTRCKLTENMFPDDDEGPIEGQAKGQKKGQQYKTNNKTNKNINTSYLLKSEQPEIPKPKTEAKKTAHRLPDDWQPNEKDWVWCQKNLIITHQQANFETEAFRDYFHSCGTASARKLDWSLAWKNWLRKANKDEERQQNYKKQADQRYNTRVSGGRISGKAIPGM